MEPETPETATNPEAAAAVDQAPTDQDLAAGALVEEDLLVEEISIDGMCGVY